MGRGRHHARGHAGRRRLDAQRHEELRARRPHRQPDHRRRPHAAGGVSLFAVDGDAAGLTRTPLSTMDQTRKQAKLEFADTPATLHRHRGRGLGRAVEGARPRRRRPRRRAGRRRPEGARHGRRVRQGARPVRPPDRLVPGDQAQVRRHAARGRVGQVGRLLRHVVRQRDERRAAVGRVAGQGLLLRGLLPRRRREHPDPRRHRLHLGAPGAPLLQAGQELRAAVRRPDVPPRAARPAHRHLNRLDHRPASGRGRHHEADDREQVERPVAGDERHVLQLGLGGDDPVERIGVVDVVRTPARRAWRSVIVERPIVLTGRSSAVPGIERAGRPARADRVDASSRSPRPRRPRRTPRCRSSERCPSDPGAEQRGIRRRPHAASSCRASRFRAGPTRAARRRSSDRTPTGRWRAGELQPTERSPLLALVLHEPGDGLAAPGDDDVVAGLDVGEQLGQLASWRRARSPSWSCGLSLVGPICPSELPDRADGDSS